MITVQTVRFNVKLSHVNAFEAAVHKIITALHEKTTDGIRYTMCKSSDGTTFFGILQLKEDQENPLLGLLEGRTFLPGLDTWLASSPERAQWTQLAAFNALEEAGESR